MAQQRIQRTFAGALAATAVMTAVGLAPTPATADPTPSTANEAIKQYKKLAGEAEKVNESYLKAKADLDAKHAEVVKAKNDTVAALKDEKGAKQQEKKLRGRVDQLSEASFRGARFSKMSAVVQGESAQEFLDRASVLQVISDDNDDAMNKLRSASEKASDARNRAQKAQQQASSAEAAAKNLVATREQRRGELDQQIGVVKEALGKLQASERKALQDPGPAVSDNGSDSGISVNPGSGSGSGAGVQAMQLALGQRGKPYVWGGESPDSGFDCSGLVKWAFGQVGISLPHSSEAQQNIGAEVSRDQLQPGDLVFFGSPAHHVGIYVGGGNMVDAPDFGQTVKVEPLNSDYVNARRLG